MKKYQQNNWINEFIYNKDLSDEAIMQFTVSWSRH